jgi:hypothetical protein
MPGVGSRRSDYSTFSARAVCGMSTAFLIFAIGIACLVVSFIGFSEQDAIECGQGGKPSLIIWVWATGVAFFVISVRFVNFFWVAEVDVVNTLSVFTHPHFLFHSLLRPTKTKQTVRLF